VKPVNPKDLRILFLCKKDNEYARRAAAFVIKNFRHHLVFEGGRKDKLPAEVLNWEGDI